MLRVAYQAEGVSVGWSGYNSGEISAGYATGDVSGGTRVGGLVGISESGSAISASYATASVSGETWVGGLVGLSSGHARSIASYWDIETSGQPHEAEATPEGKTTADLQSPTAYTGIYDNWNADIDNADGDFDPVTGADDLWDFGTVSQYPALRVDFDGDGVSSWEEFGSQPRERTTTPEPPAPSTAAPTPTPAPPLTGDPPGLAWLLALGLAGGLLFLTGLIALRSRKLRGASQLHRSRPPQLPLR